MYNDAKKTKGMKGIKAKQVPVKKAGMKETKVPMTTKPTVTATNKNM